MKKKFLPLLLAVCAACLLTMTACSAETVHAASAGTAVESVALTSKAQGMAPFSDVPANADYAPAVDWCEKNGILNGIGGDRFDPEGTLTRAMLAAALYRADGQPAVTAAPDFTDTQSGTWYSEAVSWASGNGILRGYGNGLFGTNDPVSVEQLEVIVGRYTGAGPDWKGDASKAHAATRAQVAVALYEALKNRSEDEEPVKGTGKTLVAYFSATNTTRPLAEYAADILNADLYEIVPKVPYTDADLAYYTGGRADQEQSDTSARPGISGSVKNMADYDIVFLGYPIWHSQAPKIIYTFLESYDFAGKTIVPFCTSHSSGIGSSAANLHALTDGTNWLSGIRFAAGTSRDSIAAWIDGLDLPKTPAEAAANKIAVSFNGRTYTATLADNSSAKAFAELLKNGPLTISTHDYGNFEKVGPLGTSLPTNDTRITTSPGDIILYQGNQITVYYAQNTWSFTRLGKIDDPSGLREALGSGDVDITFTLQ